MNYESEIYEEEDVEDKKIYFKEKNISFIKNNLIDKESGLSIIIFSKFNKETKIIQHYSQVSGFGKIKFQFEIFKILMNKVIPSLLNDIENKSD